MKQRDLVAFRAEPARDERPDEPGAAQQQYAHVLCLPSSRLRAPGFSHRGESRAVRRRRMAYAAWHSWPSGGILPVCTRAMNPCLVGVGPMHLPNRLFAAFRWANRKRVKQARSTWLPPSIWELRPPVVLVDTQQIAR